MHNRHCTFHAVADEIGQTVIKPDGRVGGIHTVSLRVARKNNRHRQRYHIIILSHYYPMSFGRKAHPTVQPDHLGVQIGVGQAHQHDLGKFRRIAQTAGKGDGCSNAFLHIVGQFCQKRCQKNARGHRVDADAKARQFPRGRQGQRHNPAFRRGIGGLPDLPVKGRNGCCVHNRPARAVGVGGVALHPRGSKAQHVEGANQVHLNRS